jgi:hypothetical protein
MLWLYRLQLLTSTCSYQHLSDVGATARAVNTTAQFGVMRWTEETLSGLTRYFRLQLVKKFPIFYGTRWLAAVYTATRSWVRWIQFTCKNAVSFLIFTSSKHRNERCRYTRSRENLNLIFNDASRRRFQPPDTPGRLSSSGNTETKHWVHCRYEAPEGNGVFGWLKRVSLCWKQRWHKDNGTLFERRVREQENLEVDGRITRQCIARVQLFPYSIPEICAHLQRVLVQTPSYELTPWYKLHVIISQHSS